MIFCFEAYVEERIGWNKCRQYKTNFIPIFLIKLLNPVKIRLKGGNIGFKFHRLCGFAGETDHPAPSSVEPIHPFARSLRGRDR